MNNLREAGIPFQIHTTVMKWNVNELDKMTDFAVEIGARAHHIFFLVPTGRGAEIEKQALEIKEYEEVLTDIVKKQVNCPIEVKPTCAPQFVRIAKQQNIDIRFKRGCLAGLSYCIVSPIGDVQPCAYLNIPLGNVRDTPFDEIWENNPVLKKLRTADYSGKCGICAYKNTCGGCRARAYFYEGDYMAEDKHCMYNPKTDKVENE
jgi:radical SAM protein with 4Fe4S-binding SPASM domain